MTRPAPDRPALTTPEQLQAPESVRARRLRTARQPGLGLRGLLLVVPIAVLIAIGAGGPERSLLVLGPLVTFALPAVVMIAFWWDDWPGTTVRASWSGWLDTVLVAVFAVVLTIAGQAVVARVDLPVLFDAYPTARHLATFPALMPLAGAAFTVMLQYTLVTEGWPVRRLPAIPAGIVALILSWGTAAVLYLVLVDFRPPPATGLDTRPGPVSGATFGAALTVIGVWQVWFYLAWRGWPVTRIGDRAARLLAGNAIVIVGGLASYAILAATDLRPATITAGAGALIAAGLTVAMLFEGAITGRLASVVVIVAVAAVLYAAFWLIAQALTWTRAEPVEWVAHVALNAWSVSVILHVAIGRRWPFGEPG
jgi:hypothetical protein